MGFHQIELEKGSRDITTFSAGDSLFRYNRSSVDINSAPEHVVASTWSLFYFALLSILFFSFLFLFFFCEFLSILTIPIQIVFFVGSFSPIFFEFVAHTPINFQWNSFGNSVNMANINMSV